MIAALQSDEIGTYNIISKDNRFIVQDKKRQEDWGDYAEIWYEGKQTKMMIYDYEAPCAL